IFTMNADGSDQRRLTIDQHADSEPAFSPDDKKVIFTSNRHGSASGLYEINADGGGLEKHLAHAGSNAGEASFSPNGKEIVFTRSVPVGTGERRTAEIFVMAAGGT